MKNVLKSATLALWVLGFVGFSWAKYTNETTNNKLDDKTWVWCCEHKSHATLRVTACDNTKKKYKTHKQCNDQTKNHKNAYSSHSCGCYSY